MNKAKKQSSSVVQFPEIKSEGLTFEVSADTNFAAHPLTSVKVRSSDLLLSQSFTLTDVGLGEVSECLVDIAKEIEEKYEQYWEEQKTV